MNNENKKLICTKHYMYSVVEVYLSKDNLHVCQVTCLIRNRCKKYIFETTEYIKNKQVGYELIENILNN